MTTLAQPIRILPSSISIADAVLDILNANAEVALINDVLSIDTCNSIRERYLDSPLRINRNDGVPATEIGSSQYRKSPAEYFHKAYDISNEVARICGGTQESILDIISTISIEASKQGLGLRPSVWKGIPSPIGRFSEWLKTETSKYRLRPHEDRSQTRVYDSWEISECSNIVALNIYPYCQKGSGDLIFSSWKPTDEERILYKVESTGYPYPDDVFETYPSVRVPIVTGSAAIINGDYIHAVESSNNSGGRLLYNIFFGLIDSEVIYWA